jgi:hypothetical protein
MVFDEMMVIESENSLYHYHYLQLFSLLDKVNNVNQDFQVQVKIMLLTKYFDVMIVLVMDDRFGFDE